MNPEAQHKFHMDEWRENCIKNSHAMARCRYTMVNGSRAYDFKVYMQIWQDDDWDYIEFIDFCKNKTTEHVELNTSTYKEMADTLYRAMAIELPGRNIWVCINEGDVGITVKYVEKSK